MDDQRQNARAPAAPSLTDPELAEQVMAALRRHVVEPMLPRCLDREYGGFLVDFDDRWEPAGPHDKTLEHAARTTIAFALLDRALPGDGYDQAVRHGCAFLQKAMWDDVHGGFFALVDRSGRPRWDGLKHPHAVTYVGQAFVLAEHHLPPGEGLAWAGRALAWLDEVAWDPAHGGYAGSFRRDNEAYRDGARLPTPDGRDVLGLGTGLKEINTQGDAIEMLTTFAEQGVTLGRQDRLAWLVDLVVDRLSDARGILPYVYQRDWRPVPDLVRVGFLFQMAHRLVAAAALGRTSGPVARAGELVDFALASARHPAGGFCFAVTGAGRTWPATNAASDARQWWVQLEAARALHVLACHEVIGPDARARYRRARDVQWAFVREHLLDPRSGGIWELPREPGGWGGDRLLRWLSPGGAVRRSGRKTHGWKDPLHEVGTFLALGREAPAEAR